MLLSTTTDNMIGVGVGLHDVPDDVGSGRDLGNYLSVLDQIRCRV